LDFSRLEAQWGDEEISRFSFSSQALDRPNLQCYITYTNNKTHDIIRENLHRSPLYSGKIVGNGPRYCPSIEDKVVKFPERERHQIFIEPEGVKTGEMYLNGISSSLPEEVQEAFIHSIPGLEHAQIMRIGYAVEYDYMNPNQLYPSLETKRIEGLFVAGQTNGTSGYEEAAAQGLMAGINAARRLAGKEALVLSRSEAYIGVMIDDLVTKGTEDPYRMFTSRAEHRLHLRHDTSDRRLLKTGYEVGLISPERLVMFEAKMQEMEEVKELLRRRRFKEVDTNSLEEGSRLRSHHAKTLYQALKDPEVSLKDLVPFCPALLLGRSSPDILSEVELDIKYEGYAARQEEIILSHQKLESLKIPASLDYNDIFGISNEAREKLQAVRPFTVAQASRIAGIRSSDIAILIVALRKRELPSLVGARDINA
jgi:tRNA uridine 5-carboxymethylaminomethyl modification enzyme